MKYAILIAAISAVHFAPVQSGDDPGRKGTIAFVRKLQTDNGAFLPSLPENNEKVAPTLSATLEGVISLRYLRDTLPNKEGCVQFISLCHDPVSGGFSEVPNGKPTVVATALGMLAVHELGMPIDKYAAGVMKYLSENTKGFEDIRIAAAGLEMLKEKSPRHSAWLAELRKLQNADGTFGKGPGRARFTGGAVAAILRMGAKIDDPAPIIKTLQDGQRLNGGFGKQDSEVASDLATSYRVMRCFHMLKARPRDVEGLRSFIAKCRNRDSGYAVTPGGTSSSAGTYYALIIRHWLEQK